MSGPDSSELSGKTAVVTGSSSGIGRAIALELARAGAAVLVHGGHSQAKAEAVAQELRPLKQPVSVEICDLTDPEATLQFAERAWNWRGAVDIWVNNAGADILTGVARAMSFDEKLSALLQIDVVATISLSREIGARMERRGAGVIINVGWDRAWQGMAGDAGQLFAASKAAVEGFSMSLARTLAPQVRVNCVAPGWIQTAWGEQASQVWQDRARDDSLAGRWGTPEDIAAAVRFLASPAASFITAQTIAVNGGLKH